MRDGVLLGALVPGGREGERVEGSGLTTVLRRSVSSSETSISRSKLSSVSASSAGVCVSGVRVEGLLKGEA